MKPVFQTIFGAPNGNCLQAAVASILDLPLRKVPNFIEETHWYWAYLQFLKSQGCYPIEISLQSLPEGFDGYHLMTVKSPRGNFNHSLVGKAGEPVHDPYPGGNGKHLGIVSITLLVRTFLPPSKA